MIERFEDGKSYRWIGPRSRPATNWSRYGNMDFILDGEPHKVVRVCEIPLSAGFEGHLNMQNYNKTYNFTGHEVNFEEVIR